MGDLVVASSVLEVVEDSIGVVAAEELSIPGMTTEEGENSANVLPE